MLRPAEMPIASMLPSTQFFEITSKAADATYGVWVTTPPGYDAAGDNRFPAIFMPDGNIYAPITIPILLLATGFDVMHPIAPFIQVTVGYVGEEAKNVLGVRTRDLLPPGEPLSPGHCATVDAMVASGGVTKEFAEDYKTRMSRGHADAFLSFLTEELYPQITARWRVDPASTGLWGDSYGGLFTSWVALQRPAEFRRIGAGSPGIMVADSKVLQLLEQEIAAGADHSGRHLHLSVCAEEFRVPSFYQEIGEGFARFLRIAGATPLKGLRLTSEIVPNESHMTGGLSNWTSFLRACYPAR